MPKTLALKSLILNLVLFSSTHCLAQQVLDIQPLANDPELGCVQTSEQTLISRKAKYGIPSLSSTSSTQSYYRKQLLKIKRRLQRLSGEAGSNRQKQKLVELRKELKRTRSLLRGISLCSRSQLEQSSFQVSRFDFICRHGFRSASVAIQENDCGINLSRIFVEEGGKVVPQEIQFTRGIITLLDDSLRAACESDGNTYYRNFDTQGFFPFYHGLCVSSNQEILVDQLGSIEALGMESESNDCFNSPYQGALLTSAVDPCDGYDPEAPRPNSPGGEPKPRPTPSGNDCFILRMDSESNDC